MSAPTLTPDQKARIVQHLIVEDLIVRREVCHQFKEEGIDISIEDLLLLEKQIAEQN